MAGKHSSTRIAAPRRLRVSSLVAICACSIIVALLALHFSGPFGI